MNNWFVVHCAKCNHEWNVPMKLPMPIRRAVRAMKGYVAAGCPECGAYGKNVLCGRATPPADQQSDGPVTK